MEIGASGKRTHSRVAGRKALAFRWESGVGSARTQGNPMGGVTVLRGKNKSSREGRPGLKTNSVAAGDVINRLLKVISSIDGANPAAAGGFRQRTAYVNPWEFGGAVKSSFS